MQKALRATAVALSLGLVSFAASAASDGAFLRIEGAKTRYDINATPYHGESARGLGLSAGYRWQVSAPFALGVEAGYMNMGKVREEAHGSSFRSNGMRQDVRVRSDLGTRAYLLGANGRWNMASKWSLTGRLGVAHARTRTVTQVHTGDLSTSFRDLLVNNAAYAGVGINYAVGSKVDLGLNMTHYSSTGSGLAVNERVNVNALGISAEVRL